MQTRDKTARKIVKAAFPDYRGRKIRVEPRAPDKPIDCRSYWDDGSRDYFTFVALTESFAAVVEMPAQSAYDHKVPGLEVMTLPRGIVCVQRSFFCGKDAGCTIHVRADDLAPMLPEHVSVRGI